MNYEVELSPQLAYRMFFALIVLVLLGIGQAHSTSPQGELPAILSPALFDARRYLQRAENWLRSIEDMNQEFLVLATGANADVLRLCAQVNSVAGRLFELQAEIDHTQAPIGLEPLHGQLLDLVAKYEMGIQLLSTWLSAPTADNYNELTAYLQGLPSDLTLSGAAVWSSKREPADIPSPMPNPTRLFQSNLQELDLPTGPQSDQAECDVLECRPLTREPEPWE